MRKQLLTIVFLFIVQVVISQNLWQKNNVISNSTILENKKRIITPNLFEVDIPQLKELVASAPQRFVGKRISNTIVSFPNREGNMETFRIMETSNMDPALAARFPEIKSYMGQGVVNKSTYVYFSLSPLGLQSMTVYPDRSVTFIEPYNKDASLYVVYNKSDKTNTLNKFECRIIDEAQNTLNNAATARPNADDALLRTYRLALSVTGEYTAYFGGTKVLALAAMNNTMTRVNAVFEMDFGARMNLIANNDILIYTNASTDPYSAASTGAGGAWNTELQNNLTNTIGNATYDIGHLFGATGGGGNAGCIGCICVDDTTSTTDKNKGSGYTSPADGIPSGDNFDIDYVAHEMGHQFGANHTFSHSNEGTGANMEPGSGSTIMGYAGITSQDIQPHSDAYFHAISIQQVTNNIKAKTCSVNTATGNSIPTVNAGLDYTIPKSTAFKLTGTATDANGDALTYCWEEFDNAASTATGVNSAASATRTSGPTFRSYNPTANTFRYFPLLSSTLAGATTTSGTEILVEALPSVARTMNFRLTVRDNRAGGSANNSDDMIVTVDGTAGPFVVTAPNSQVSYLSGSTQTVTWNVAGTTANGVNCANVDILISIDGGTNWTTLLAATPNDGSQVVTMPTTTGNNNRIMVRGTNHIFFDVSNTNFTISNTADTTPPSAPTLSASGTTATTTNLSWTTATDNVGVVGYDVYQGATLIGSTTTATTFAVTGLTALTSYSFTVKAKDGSGNISTASNTVTITTSAPDTTPPNAPTLSASGTTSTTTNLSWTAATDNIGVTGYDVYRGTTLIGSTTTATTFSVTGLTASTTYTFNVKAKDAAGNISTNSNTVTVTTLYATYCASQGNSVTDELIGRVQFGTIDNVSTGGTGYTDFTSISTTITRGTTQTITITPTWTGTIFDEGYAVFIDYNRDGDFADAGETVWTKAASKDTPVSGTFTIPASATIGNTRMRVSLKYNGIPTSCETYSYGQVEDYTVVFVADTTAPTAPVLSASNTSQTTTDLSWTTATDNVGVIGYDVYQGNTLIGSTTTANLFSVTGLTSSTTYTFNVKAKDAAGNITSSNTVTITTTSSNLIVNLKLFIEGYYDTTTNLMRPVLLNQGVGVSTTNMDNITVELRSSPSTLIATTTVILQTNGTAVCTFPNINSGLYYIVAKHRNSITTWSSTPQNISSIPLTYDFTTSSNKAYGNNMKAVQSGVFAIYSGDINQDGFIEALDYAPLLNDNDNVVEGYNVTDLNGDGFVEGSDFPILINNSDNIVETISP